jgi:multidrug resistance efflux pump
MTWLQRVRRVFGIRTALYLLGICLALGSLLGARALTGGQTTEPSPEPPREVAQKMKGPVVLGTVDSNPQPIFYGLPPVLQSGTIARVYVRDGAEIHAGDKLYEFETSPLRSTLKVAESAVNVAKTKVDEAKEAVKQYERKVELGELAVRVAKQICDSQAAAYNVTETNLKDYYGKEKIPESQWAGKLAVEEKLILAHNAYIRALSEFQVKEGDLKALKAGKDAVAIMVEQAEAGVKRAEAEVAQAQTAIDLCTIRAKLDGTVEQVTISEGSTLGVSTMKPALWLIPKGPRVVRAEIEADFAHRVTINLIGKEVTIYDNTDPKLTYKGMVKRIGDTFLVKRSSNEGLLASETRVLEAEIVVTDAAPRDRPPLRVGQRVRVDLGQ